MNEPWSLIGVGITCLFGGSFIPSVMNWSTAKKRGTREDDREDNNSANSALSNLVQAQLTTFIQPMQEELEKMRKRLESLEKEVEEQKNRYWKVVGYARNLLYWIERTFPGHGHTVPRAAESIRTDIEIS